MTAHYKNILIVRTDRIGDVVLTTPAIAAVRANFPNARITVLVSSATRELVDGNPNIDAVLVDNRQKQHKGVLGFWRLVGELRKHKFDAAIVFHTKRRTNLLCFWAGIPVRIGYRDKNYGFLLTQGLEDSRHRGEQHESQYCLDVLRQLGLNVGEPSPFLPVSADAQKFIEEWLRAHGLLGAKIIAIHPGASDPARCWPIDRFARLIDELASIPGHKVVVFGAGETVDSAQELKMLCVNPFFDLSGQTTVGETVAFLKQCRLLISNDSGPGHIASAVGIYVITLFLRNQPGINPERWKPLGPKSFIISNKPHEAVQQDRSGQIVSGQKNSIQVEEVASLAKDLLQR